MISFVHTHHPICPFYFIHLLYPSLLINSYYGLVLWFPEYFKYIECQSDNNHSTTDISGCSSNAQDNKIYLDNLYVSLATIPGGILNNYCN